MDCLILARSKFHRDSNRFSVTFDVSVHKIWDPALSVCSCWVTKVFENNTIGARLTWDRNNPRYVFDEEGRCARKSTVGMYVLCSEQSLCRTMTVAIRLKNFRDPSVPSVALPPQGSYSNYNSPDDIDIGVVDDRPQLSWLRTGNSTVIYANQRFLPDPCTVLIRVRSMGDFVRVVDLSMWVAGGPLLAVRSGIDGRVRLRVAVAIRSAIAEVCFPALLLFSYGHRLTLCCTG
jgi:hypothetical protein